MPCTDGSAPSTIKLLIGVLYGAEGILRGLTLPQAIVQSDGKYNEHKGFAVMLGDVALSSFDLIVQVLVITQSQAP